MLAAAAIAAAGGLAVYGRPAAGDGAPGVRRVVFSYETVVRALPPGGPVDLWLPLPADDERQEIDGLAVEAPGSPEIVADPAYGNRFARVRFRPAAGETEARVAVRFGVTRRAYRAGASGPSRTPADLRRHLESNRLIQSAGPPSDEARRVAGAAATPIEKARALYDHILGTMRYDKTGPGPGEGGWGRGDALYACDARAGNCTDFHSLFIAEARALGIPARFLMGVPLPRDVPAGGVDVPGYHCWAEFWWDGAGWVPVDISEAWKDPSRRDELFGGLDADRVLFSVGRDITPPGAAAPPLNYVVYPHVEVGGRPHAAVETRFRVEPVPDDGPARALGARLPR